MASEADSVRYSKERTNYLRLCRLLVDVGAHVLRIRFDKIHPPENLERIVADPAMFDKLESLRKEGILNVAHFGKLYPAIRSSVSSQTFDATLLFIFLRTICDLTPPATGWDNPPQDTDTTPEADMVRIRVLRDKVYSHDTNALIDDPTYSSYWKDSIDTLVRLGGLGDDYQSAFDDLQKEDADPDFEEHYGDLLRQWIQNEDKVKDKIDIWLNQQVADSHE